MKSPRWLNRLGSSLLIGGQAVSATTKAESTPLICLISSRKQGLEAF
jgi:phospholipid/cholesterol/gamma-HCH transport system permease protein